MKKVVSILIFITLSVSTFGQINNEHLSNLKGDFKAAGQVLALNDGFLIQITQYDLGGYIPEGSTATMFTMKNNAVWLIKIDLLGNIKWKIPFDNGCSSMVFDFIEHQNKYIGFVTDCKPEILVINSDGNIEYRKKLDSLKGASRPQILNNGRINFIGEKITFEGFVPTKYNPDHIYLSTVVEYHSIVLDEGFKPIEDITLDSLELEAEGNDFPVFNLHNRYYYFPWKNGELYLFNTSGKQILKTTLKADPRTNEIIYSDFMTNISGDFVFCRTSYFPDPKRHLGKIEIVAVDSTGNQIFCTEISGPTSWNSRQDLIQTSDNGYVFIMYTNVLTVVKLDKKGSIVWLKEYPQLTNTKLHMSVCENEKGDLVILSLNKTSSGEKPYLITIDKKGQLVQK